MDKINVTSSVSILNRVVYLCVENKVISDDVEKLHIRVSHFFGILEQNVH